LYFSITNTFFKNISLIFVKSGKKTNLLLPMHKHTVGYFQKMGLVIFLIFCVFTTQSLAQTTAPCTKYTVENTNNFCGCSAQQFVPYGLFLEANNGCGLEYFKSDSVVFEVRNNNTAALRGTFRTFDGEWRPIYVNINFNVTEGNTPRLELCNNGRPASIAAAWRYFGAMSGTIQFENAAPLSISSRNGDFQMGVGANGQNPEELGAAGYFTLSSGQRGGFGFKLNNPTATTCILTHPCDNDTTRPVFSNCPANINLTTTGNSATATWTAPTARDNCAPTVSLSSNYNSGASFPVGTTTVIYAARDTSRNVVECRFNIIVTRLDTCANDTTRPVFRNCPANISLNTTGTNAVATWTAPTATDNCTTPSVTSNFSSGASFPVGSTTVIYTARDAKNNTAECRFNIVVVFIDTCASDTTRPVFRNCPVNISLTTTGANAVATWTPPTATDNCTTPSVISNFSSGQTFPIGTTTVIYTARDARNNTSECRFNVVVNFVDTCLNDTIRPVFRNCPASTNWTTTGMTALVTWTAPTVTDNCSTPSVSSNFSSGSNFPLGVTTVIYTARDVRGNTAECRFNITVTTTDSCINDTTRPVFRNCPANISLTTTGLNTIATWTAPTVTDNCSTPSVTVNIPSGASFAIGSTSIVYTARDAKGNTAECRFTVTVTPLNGCSNDREKPIFIGCPLPILQTTTNTSAIVRWTAPTVTDNCSTPSVTSNFTSGQTFPVGTSTVVYTARDAVGNTATCQFSITLTRRTLSAGVCTQFQVENTNNICGCPERQWTPYVLQVNKPNGCPDFYKADQVTFEIFGDSTARLKGVFRTLQWRPIYVDMFWSKTNERKPRFEACQADSTAADNWQYFGAAQGTIRFDDQHPVNLFHRSQLQVGVGANGQNRDLLGGSALFETDNGIRGSFNFVLQNRQVTTCPAACVSDTTKPFFTNCPQNVTQLASDFPVQVNWSAPFVDDICSSPNLAVNYLPNTGFQAGSTTVIYTARDASGNQAECRFDVTINRVPSTKLCTFYDVDNTNNICGCRESQWKPYALHVESAANCGVYYKADSVRLQVNGNGTVSVRGVFRNDDWQPAMIEMTFAKAQGGRPRLDYCQGSDSTVAARWEYFGQVSGSIKFQDGAPIFVSSLPNTYLQIGLGANNQNLDVIGARAVFNLADGRRANFSMILKNKTQAICGNITPCDFDSLPPTFTNCPANITVQTANSSANVNWTPPTVRDNCAATPSVSSNYAPNTNFPIGTTTVIYSALDSIGNVGQCRFDVVVTQNACLNDTIAPTLGSCPRDVAVTTTNATVTLNWRLPTATDNCGTPTLTSSVPTDFAFPNGLTTVTITARDGAGNSSSCRFNVTITVMTATNDPLSKNGLISLNYIAPNPASNFLVIDLESQTSGQWHFDVLNTLGQTVNHKDFWLNLGNNRFNLDVANLAKGIYFIRFKDSQRAVRFVKM
jgi:hypothetical protein